MNARQQEWLRAAALVLCLGASVAAAQQPPAAPAAPASTPNREQLERKLVSTRTLIESSSGARQIEASGRASAQAERARARELHGQASEALRAGQLEAASKLLDETARAMFAAVRESDTEQVVGRKQRTDLEARMESTRALLEAQKRIATEKNSGAPAREVQQRVEKLLAEAGELAKADRIADARRSADQAYLLVKASTVGLRDGDTMVRSLHFATKAEEYHYEIDRNDTHRMLVDVLLKEKRASAGVDAMVEQALAAARQLREQAEKEAARRDHDTAVRTLELSTRELVKAIRAAGVYIPG